MPPLQFISARQGTAAGGCEIGAKKDGETPPNQGLEYLGVGKSIIAKLWLKMQVPLMFHICGFFFHDV